MATYSGALHIESLAMTSRKVIVSAGFALAVLAGSTTACGSDDSSSPATVSVSASSQAQSVTPTSNSDGSTSGASASQPGNGASEVGVAQTVTGEGFVASITVNPNITVTKTSFGATVVTVPVSIDVKSGRLAARSSIWRLITLSGQSITGDTSSANPTAIGDTPIDGRAEGVLTFTDSSKLAGEVKLSEIDVVASDDYSATPKPLARWKLATPVAVSALPAAPQ